MSFSFSDSFPDAALGASTNEDETNERVLVQGAEGHDFVNGLYKRVDTHDGVGKYSKKGRYDGQFGRSIEAHAFRRDESDGTKRWCIANDSNEYYSALICDNDPDYPPSKGWNGSPAPTVEVMSVRKSCALPAVTVIEPVASIYQRLLLSEETSDVQFICEGGVVIPTHKNILVASSSYFKAALNGPWKENQSGLINTSHPAHVIQETLALMYTGKTSSDLVKEAPLAFIGVASEFDLPWLKTLAEPYSVRSLDEHSLKDLWQAGRLYDSAFLRKACIDYAKKNPLTVLTNSEIITLKFDDPTSWEEFVNAVASK